MGKVVRFGVSIEPELLQRFDAWLAAKGFASRSQGFREIVRGKLQAAAFAAGDAQAVATVTFVYDHHKRDLMERLADLQHDHLSEIVSSLHVHLDHQHCLEVLVLRGRASEVGALADRIIATKGVLSGDVNLGMAGGDPSPRTTPHPPETGESSQHVRRNAPRAARKPK